MLKTNIPLKTTNFEKGSKYTFDEYSTVCSWITAIRFISLLRAFRPRMTVSDQTSSFVHYIFRWFINYWEMKKIPESRINFDDENLNTLKILMGLIKEIWKKTDNKPRKGKKSTNAETCQGKKWINAENHQMLVGQKLSGCKLYWNLCSIFQVFFNP